MECVFNREIILFLLDTPYSDNGKSVAQVSTANEQIRKTNRDGLSEQFGNGNLPGGSYAIIASYLFAGVVSNSDLSFYKERA